MSNITVLGVDISKHHFQLHGLCSEGHTIYKKSVSRKNFVRTVVNLGGEFIIAMEACGGANHWGRHFASLGFDVKLISAQYVKGFVRGSKNDANDAAGIAMAARQPSMVTVAIKTLEQQDMQTLLRIRESFVKQRTITVNSIRGFLQEYGEVIPQGITQLRKHLPHLLEDADNGLTMNIRAMLKMLYEQYCHLDKLVAEQTKRITTVAKQIDACKRMMMLKGVGPLIALATYTKMGDAKHFKNGRHFAAYLGLVPKEHSTGGKHLLLGISKRGDTTLRGLLIHGSRAVLHNIADKQDKLSQWLRALKDSRGHNRCCVAMANKLARHLWAIMARGNQYVIPPEMAS